MLSTSDLQTYINSFPSVRKMLLSFAISVISSLPVWSLTGLCCCCSVSCVQLFATQRTAVHQDSLSITISWSLLKLMSIESVMPSNHLILCCPLLLLPSILPSIRVFSNELAHRIRWPKCWSFSISPSNEYSGLISFRIDLMSKGLSRLSSPAPQFESIDSSALSFLYGSILTSLHDYWKNHSFD